MSDRGHVLFAADDGTQFRLPVNEDGTCGPMPRAGVAIRWEPPPLPTVTKTVKFKDAQSAATFADALRQLGCDVTTHRSDE